MIKIILEAFRIKENIKRDKGKNDSRFHVEAMLVKRQ